MKRYLATTALILTMAVGGISMAEHHEGPGHHKGMPQQMEEALSKLPAEKAELVKSAFKEMREGRKEKHESMKADHEALRNLLKAEEFDRSAYLSKAAELDKKKLAQKAKFHEKIADIAEQLTAKERTILIEAMPKPGRHHGRYKGRQGGEHHKE